MVPTDIAFTGTGAVLVAAPGDASEAMGVFTSPDLATWVALDMSAFAADGAVSLNGVASRGPDSVIVGGTYTAPSEAAVWRSVDGVTWQRVPSPSFSSPDGDLRMVKVAATPSGYVAVGSLNDSSAVVWTSVDGSAWQRVDSPAFRSERDLVMRTVASGPHGYVAGGGALGETISGVVWLSPDGATWERVELPPAEDAASTMLVWGVASSAHGYVAVGSNQEGTKGVLWHSNDGRAWVRVTEPAVEDSPGLLGVAATDLAFVAVGGTPTVLRGAS
jgi:hypothetical protein